MDSPADAPTSALATPQVGSDSPQAFASGTLLAGRYEIVRLIARGGMGEVYEARDRELGGSVAIKTIRPEVAADQAAIERFKREILMARRITHPNVSRIFDLGLHRDATGQAEVAFLTMELLSGETLAARIRRSGRMSADESLPLACQMALGLGAAHKSGIVHRDFKSANVVLVPEDGGRLRAVVTDFGLARRHDAGANGDHWTTQSGAMLGTPAYLSPEQIEGGAITPATDVYALGIVLYEMLTGVTPFGGETPLSTAVKRLTEAPVSPRSHVPGLDATWERTVLRCLERDPRKRFQGVQHVIESLCTGSHRRYWPIAIATGLVALSAGVVVIQTRRARLPPPRVTAPQPVRPAQVRRSVAVLGFRNLSGRPETAWLSTALAEMMATELAAGEGLRVVPGESVARMKLDLRLSESDGFGKETLGRIRTQLGSDFVVLGSYTALRRPGAGQVRLDLRLQDAGIGETVASVAETGDEADMFDMVTRCGRALRQRLGIAAAAAAGGATPSLPAGGEALRLYAEGLSELRLFDALNARDLLLRAAAADPASPLVHSALSQAWSELGYDAKARDEASQALALADRVGREERLGVEARYHEAAKDWDKAVETYRTLFGFFPDNLEYGLALARALSSGGKGSEAFAALLPLRALPAPSGQDPRIDLVEAEVAEAIGDFKREREAARRAVARAHVLGARLLEARARLAEGWANQNLDQPREAVAAGEAARTFLEAAGDEPGVAVALTMIATARWRHGDLAAARKTYESALAISRKIGQKSGEARALNNLANVVSDLGDLAEAKRLLEAAVAISRETGDDRRAAIGLQNLANIVRDEGDVLPAIALYEEAITLFRRVGHEPGTAVALQNLAECQLLLGDLDSSRRRVAEALPILRAAGDRHGIAYTTYLIAEQLRLAGDLPQARTKHAEALAIREALGETALGGDSKLALARIDIDEGRAARAEAVARELAEQYAKEKARGPEATALEVLASALLGLGRIDDARAAIERSQSGAAKTGEVLLQLRVSITAGRILAATAPAQAVALLGGVVERTQQAHLASLELEATLALGEAELRTPEAASGRARLAALLKHADAKGFHLIARRAQDSTKIAAR